jgi:hypothetical protein
MRRPTQFFAALLLLSLAAACARVRPDGRKSPTLPLPPPDRPVLEDTGPAEGWPPRVKGATNVKVVPWKEIPGSLTDALEQRIHEGALQNAEVRRALGERFAYVSTDEVEPKKGAPAHEALQTRVTFFSHTNNVAVEVAMNGLRVERTDRREGYDPPEGRDEVKAAVDLALRDRRLEGRAARLRGEAIVLPREPDAREAALRSHRVLYVSFMQGDEDVPRYVAVVDLTDRRVLSARAEGREMHR